MVVALSYLGVSMVVDPNPMGLQMIMLLGDARKDEERSLRPDFLLLCSCLDERALCLELLGRIAARFAFTFSFSFHVGTSAQTMY